MSNQTEEPDRDGEEIKKHSSNRFRFTKRRIVSGALALALMLAGIALYQYQENTRCPPYDYSEANRYYMNEFVPRYRRDQCIVRIDFEYSGQIGSKTDDIIFSEFSCYIAEHEPKALAFSYGIPAGSPRRNSVFLQFADQCDRRFDIAEALAAHMNRKYTGIYYLKASRDLIKPGPDTIEAGGGLWLDGDI